MQSLDGLIPILLTVAPQSFNLLAPGTIGTILIDVADAGEKVFGTMDPAELAARLADPSPEGQDKAAIFKAEILNKVEAMHDLLSKFSEVQAAQSPRTGISAMLVEWGAAVVSILVTIGFCAILTVWLFHAPNPNDQVLALLVGTLAAAFTQSVNYWLGSSLGSADKSLTLRQIATSAPTAAVNNATEKVVAAVQQSPTKGCSP